MFNLVFELNQIEVHSFNMFKSITDRVVVISISLFVGAVGSWADTSPSQPCFDFSSPIKATLKKPVQSKPKGDVTDSGELSSPKKGLWGLARGPVNFPIQKVYQQLLNHYTIKDGSRAKLKVYPQERTGYQDYHVVMVKLATPLMDVDWEEEWGYVIAEGTEADPKKVIISYQKTNGTKYMPHLCGSIMLTATNPNTTDVYLYEEINALGKRSHKDTVKGHLGTLTTLRSGVVPGPKL